MKPLFRLGCYGCIFHGTGNSAQLCQNFEISGRGEGMEQPKAPLYTPLVSAEVRIERFRNAGKKLFRLTLRGRVKILEKLCVRNDECF
jgi:hypothetical protein